MRVRKWMAAGFTAVAVMAPAGAAAAAEPAATTPGTTVGHVLEGEEYHGKYWWRADCDADGRAKKDANPARYSGHECRQGDTWPYMWNLWMITH
ncbi:hypothetical protein [Glycomyces paridis]|uniref:Uncharacterized protein n=1 Tax=Glycomyces paridis TaxID=2126555 RepID=A0A4S8PH99_9ACTN|nr:hypothetical protein [Glycomyces paridis]THV28712.1 hypothetical protein E9998_11440 [Glycomyces paridis]